MSKYTTGELAKLCGVSVRTVQYYDSRNILASSELSEGGRWLYSEDDLKRMQIICFLRDLDLPFSSIGELLSEEHPENVISILLDEKETTLQKEIEEKQIKLDKLSELKKALKTVEHFSVESIGDVVALMNSTSLLNGTKSAGIYVKAIVITVVMCLACLALSAPVMKKKQL